MLLYIFWTGDCFSFQQFGPILDVEIIFNERGSKVSSRRPWAASHPYQPTIISLILNIISYLANETLASRAKRVYLSRVFLYTLFSTRESTRLYSHADISQ